MEEESFTPEMYSEDEMETIEKHIETYFGHSDQVFHEIISPDIHVDIVIIAPTPERNYYVLVSMGMGAHRMNVPDEFKEHRLERAEILVCLPPDWKVFDDDERWYWPIRWLKIMARLPIEQDTWLGWGHTVPAGEPFAENTKLCCMLLLDPEGFPREALQCELPGSQVVNFYQMFPLYEEEMNFKVANSTEALLECMDDAMVMPVQINRKNFCKKKGVLDKVFSVFGQKTQGSTEKH